MAPVKQEAEAEALQANVQVQTQGQKESHEATASDEKTVNSEEDTPISSTAESYKKIDPPPNGGLLAWLQVLGSFFLYFNCWYVTVQG